MSELSEYDLSTCDRKIKELSIHLINPTGPHPKIPHALGQLTLLYQQRAELQAQEHAKELQAMQAACRAEQEKNSHLRHIIETCTEQDQAVQEHEALDAKVKGQQKGGHSQTELPPLELISLMTGPGADVISGGASGTETLGEKLRAQLRNPHAEEALLWRARHTQQSTAPTPSTPKGGPDSTPRRAVTWDRYEVLQMPFQRTHSIHSSQKEHILHGAMLIHTTTTEGIRPGGLKEISQSATQAGAHHDSRSRPGWSATPGARDGGHKEEYCGTHESEDPDDSAPPQREEICTRQLEPLKKDIYRFDPDNRGFNEDNTVVLAVQIQLNVDPALEDDNFPHAKMNPSKENQVQRPFQQGAPQNQGGEDFNQPHKQFRPQHLNPSQQRSRGWNRRKPYQYQEYRCGDRNPTHGMHPGTEE